jgi:thiosulfate/3-mercaptopyruvate sulfurtransferase
MRNALLFALIVASWPAIGLAGQEQGYARPELLLEPAELAEPEVAEEFVILDAGSEDRYKKSHVPRALWVDHDAWKAAFGNGRDARGWSERIGALGIRADSNVVVYDGQGMKNAGRIWWILRYWGVDDVRLLNGGWKGWTAGDFETTDAAPPSPAPADFEAAPWPNRLATTQQMLSLVRGDRVQVVDARSDAEYCGIDARDNKRAGAMPGARHLEWTELIDASTGRFKPAQELRRLFDEAGIDLGRPTATHCQSGGRASVMAFAVELMGAENVRNYFHGWSEWGNSETTPIIMPTVEPEEPKQGQ